MQFRDDETQVSVLRLGPESYRAIVERRDGYLGVAYSTDPDDAIRWARAELGAVDKAPVQQEA